MDVLVAGGGPAGCTTAAAMAQLGLRTLIADAGQDRHKMLAGELLHPVAIEELTAFGFREALSTDGAPIVGFAVVDGAKTALLPYAPGNRGLGIEHHALVLPLLDILERRRDVQVRRRTRVNFLSDGPDGVEVTLSSDGRSERVRARMLVAADGRASPLRRAVGIPEEHDRLSTMVGVLVDATALPHAGRGHLFIGGPAPVLAYPISITRARVMVDLPLGSAPDQVRDPETLSGVPMPLRQAILDAVARETPLVAASETRQLEAAYKGHVVLVGDAAGCCHPLSTSGIASAVRDSRALEQAMRTAKNDVPRALAAYARARRPANRTRIALASALYEAFCSETAEMAALRGGLFRYWERSPTGTRISMSLLSTREARMSVMAREYARVVAHGLVALGAGSVRAVRGPRRAVRAGARLVASALPHVRTAMAGAVEDRILALPPPQAQVPAAAESLGSSRASPSRS
ncbi:MAG: FAD-dependent monooxygenase [Myxococcaceae bacterium]